MNGADGSAAHIAAVSIALRMRTLGTRLLVALPTIQSRFQLAHGSRVTEPDVVGYSGARRLPSGDQISMR
jgi:hypothetical protein